MPGIARSWSAMSPPDCAEAALAHTAPMARWGWVVYGLGVAALLSYVTYVGSVGTSCGAFDSGPNPGAEEDWCGYGAGEPASHGAIFVLVQLIPAIPALAGGCLAAVGRSRLYAPAGVLVSFACMAVIWALEP